MKVKDERSWLKQKSIFLRQEGEEFVKLIEGIFGRAEELLEGLDETKENIKEAFDRSLREFASEEGKCPTSETLAVVLIIGVMHWSMGEKFAECFTATEEILVFEKTEHYLFEKQVEAAETAGNGE